MSSEVNPMPDSAVPQKLDPEKERTTKLLAVLNKVIDLLPPAEVSNEQLNKLEELYNWSISPNVILFGVVYDHILSKILLENQSKVITAIDLGGGNGQMLERALKKDTRVNGVLIDPSTDAIARARTLLSKYEEEGRLQIIQDRYDKLSPAIRAELAGKGDFVTGFGATDFQDFFSYIARATEMTKPGGTVLTVDYYQGNNNPGKTGEVSLAGVNTALADVYRSFDIPISVRNMFVVWMGTLIKQMKEWSGANGRVEKMSKGVSSIPAVSLDDIKQFRNLQGATLSVAGLGVFNPTVLKLNMNNMTLERILSLLSIRFAGILPEDIKREIQATLSGAIQKES